MPGRVGARAEEPARGIDADLVEHLVEGDELARSLAHRDLDAVAHEPDPGDEQHAHGLAVVAHRLGRVPDAGDRAVVVDAPDVDELVEAAAELLGDVADVGGEVRRQAVGPIDDPVLVVAERRWSGTRWRRPPRRRGRPGAVARRRARPSRRRGASSPPSTRRSARRAARGWPRSRCARARWPRRRRSAPRRRVRAAASCATSGGSSAASSST